MKLFAGLIAMLLGLGWFSLPPESPEPIDTQEATEFSHCSFAEHQEERWEIGVDDIGSGIKTCLNCQLKV
jgi:hypothetical protein